MQCLVTVWLYDNLSMILVKSTFSLLLFCYSCSVGCYLILLTDTTLPLVLESAGGLKYNIVLTVRDVSIIGYCYNIIL